MVWASGTRGRVARTTDGGKAWRVDSIAGADSLDFRDIHALSATRAWAMSAGRPRTARQKFFARRTARPGPSNTTRIRRRFPRRHLVLGRSPRHRDERSRRGTSVRARHRRWRRNVESSPDGKCATGASGEAAFAASGTCLAVQGSSNVWIATGGGARARVFRSTDRGRTWSVADTPVHAGGSAAGIFSVAFSDAQHGVVVGGEYTKPKVPSVNVALTDDGGRTWRQAKGPRRRDTCQASRSYRRRTVVRSWRLGLRGTAQSSDGGESWKMVDTVAYNSVAFASRNDGWAAGPAGRIAKWCSRCACRQSRNFDRCGFHHSQPRDHARTAHVSRSLLASPALSSCTRVALCGQSGTERQRRHRRRRAPPAGAPRPRPSRDSLGKAPIDVCRPGHASDRRTRRANQPIRSSRTCKC